MIVRFQMPYAKLGEWWFIAIPLLVGNLILKHRKDMLFSERNGGTPGVSIGPLRISWAKYRKLPSRSGEQQ
ncbi:hypothetical protein [Mesorhizobium caraganae]|uniref:hypothetical protein n=1 Tax=Mesorhizobium caraganae TaxID=483206 RepID=UPI0017834D89|nr:hypothetical protein [Mesorhizobium caraganae]